MTWRGVCAMLRLILHDEPVLVASDPERFNEKHVRREMAINITMLWLSICGLSIIFCSITTNTSSPHYHFLFLGIPLPSRITWLRGWVLLTCQFSDVSKKLFDRDVI